MGFWRQKHGSFEMLKYRKIMTCANPKISIRCKPNIFVLFKSPKISTSKNRPWVFFLASKIWFFWNTLRFWHVIYLTFWYNIGPKSLYSLKIPRFWQVKYAMGFWRQKTCFLWNNPRFWRVLQLGLGYDVGAYICSLKKNPTFRQPTQTMCF